MNPRNGTASHPENPQTDKPPQFTIEAIVTVRIEVGLALRLGQFILDNQNGDKVLTALGHQLNNIVPEIT